MTEAHQGGLAARREPRPEPRAELRPEDSRAEAERRAAELLAQFEESGEGADDFLAPDPPDGWEYEWRRHTVYNAEDPTYQVSLARMGWEPVPVSRHPAFMPQGYKGKAILRDGMMLMQRPKIINDRARARALAAARDQVRGQEQAVGLAPAGQFERNNKGSPLASVKTSIEAPMAIPE